MIPFIIFINNDSPGLIQDAIIYQKYIPNSFILNKKDVSSTIIPSKYYIILLENLNYMQYPANFNIFKNAKRRYFMVNIDLFFINLKLYQYIDVYICKYKFTEKCIHKMVQDNLLSSNIKTYYTKHTSIFSEEFELYNPLIKKDFNLFLHSAGKSPFKNTSLVLETWLNYNLPPIYITCYSLCFNLIYNTLKDKYDLSIDNLKKHNIIFINESIDLNEIIKLKNKCGIHVCPSMKEGYGHYMNECRQVKSVCITIDVEPYNEIINNKCGFLIPYETKMEDKINKHYDYTFNPDILASTVKKIIKTPKKELKRMADIAYNYQLADLDFLKNRLNKIRKYTN